MLIFSVLVKMELFDKLWFLKLCKNSIIFSYLLMFYIFRFLFLCFLFIFYIVRLRCVELFRIASSLFVLFWWFSIFRQSLSVSVTFPSFHSSFNLVSAKNLLFFFTFTYFSLLFYIRFMSYCCVSVLSTFIVTFTLVHPYSTLFFFFLFVKHIDCSVA